MAAAARCLPLGPSPLAPASSDIVKAPASVPSSSYAAAVACPPLRTAVVPSFGHRLPAPPVRCSSSYPESPSAPELAVLLEVEGVLADVYRFGNRQAFNHFKVSGSIVQTGQSLYMLI
uniref:Uncharacterized protein n=1 Tax=Arundo donax TaxID=35708 RepID=A0A0A9FBP5_ARUDO